MFTLGGVHVKRYLMDESKMLVVYGIKFKLYSDSLEKSDQSPDEYLCALNS